MDFGDNLKALRKAEDLTQEELAERTGISRETIVNYENKRRKNPPAEILASLASFFGVSMEELRGREEAERVTMIDTSTGEVFENNILIRFPKGHRLYVPTLQELEEQEEVFLEIFRSMNYYGREQALEIVRILAEVPRFKPKNKTKSTE